MNILIDKLLLYLLSSTIYISTQSSNYMIILMLIVIIISSLLSYFDSYKLSLILLMVFFILCIFKVGCIYFLPVFCYDILRIKKQDKLFLVLLILLIYQFLNNPIYTCILTLLFMMLSVLLQSHTSIISNIQLKYNILRDTAKESSIQFIEKNKALLEKQDYEINLATLTERNRIARDIHDNVGHLLSRSILQTGALLATEQDENRKESLNTLKDTLVNAMDSIRSSVHDLHDQSIDLYTEITSILNKFTFCRVHLEYDIEDIEQQNIKYCFITVVKEALSNIIKHSDADNVTIALNEHPALYQLIIRDNGSDVKMKNDSNGIGIKSIYDRVASLNGNIHISTDKGFRIFISIPKT